MPSGIQRWYPLHPAEDYGESEMELSSVQVTVPALFNGLAQAPEKEVSRGIVLAGVQIMFVPGV